MAKGVLWFFFFCGFHASIHYQQNIKVHNIHNTFNCIYIYMVWWIIILFSLYGLYDEYYFGNAIESTSKIKISTVSKVFLVK